MGHEVHYQVVKYYQVVKREVHHYQVVRHYQVVLRSKEYYQVVKQFTTWSFPFRIFFVYACYYLVVFFVRIRRIRKITSPNYSAKMAYNRYSAYPHATFGWVFDFWKVLRG